MASPAVSALLAKYRRAWPGFKAKIPILFGSPLCDPQIDFGANVIESVLKTLSIYPKYVIHESKGIEMKHMENKELSLMIPIHSSIEIIWKFLYELFGTKTLETEGAGLIHASWQKNCMYTNLPVDMSAWEELAMLLDDAGINIIIDAGCGRGFFTAVWKYYLESYSRIASLRFIAYDIVRPPVPFIPVLKLSEDKQIKLLDMAKDNYILMLLWPTYGSPMAEKSLRAFKGNNLIISVDNIPNDYEGSCCATPQFFHDLEAGWNLVRIWPLHTTRMRANILAWCTRKK